MTFADLVAGDSVFVDANTFVYHFAPDPSYVLPCRDLLLRIENQELQGFTSTHVLSEVAHRLMTIEAMQRFGWPFQGIAQRLRKHPSEVQQLTKSHRAVEEVLQGRIQILTVAPAAILAGTAVSQQTGLLHNDALIVAVMQAHGLTRLASGDADFRPARRA